MNSTERRMQIYLMMQNKKSLRIKDIAEEFAVTKRTVYRDISYLRDLNVPITHDPDFGYGIMRDAHIKPLMFTNREVATIMMGLSFLKSQSDETIVEDAQKVKNKIHSAVPGELKEFMSAIEQKTVVAPYHKKMPLVKKGGNWFSVLSAISNNKVVSFSYTNKNNESSTRTIDPLLVAYFTDHWNVIGYCHSKDGIRNFILDRMKNVEIKDIYRKSKKSYSLNELLYNRQDKTHLIEVHINNPIVDSFILNLPAEVVSKEALDDDKTLVTFYFNDIEYINEWLLFYTKNVVVKGPEILTIKRKGLLEELMNKA